MRLAQKFALSFASLAFIVVVLPAMFKQQEPTKVILIGFVASLLSGIVGYVMGKILTHPKVTVSPKPKPIPPAAPPPLKPTLKKRSSMGALGTGSSETGASETGSSEAMSTPLLSTTGDAPSPEGEAT